MTFPAQLQTALAPFGKGAVRIAADACGVTQPTIRNWLAGKSTPSVAEQQGALAILSNVSQPQHAHEKRTRSRRDPHLDRV